MKKRAKRVSDRLKRKKKDKRRHVNLWLSGDLFKRFKDACGETSASETLEEFMREYLGE